MLFHLFQVQDIFWKYIYVTIIAIIKRYNTSRNGIKSTEYKLIDTMYFVK